MTKMATTPIYGRNPSKSSPEPAGRFSPWTDLDLFYDKVNFGNLGFSIGKSENSGSFRNYCRKWPENW